MKLGKIFCLMGKSSSGKDTIYKKLLKDKSLGLKPYVLHTTRPIRESEKEGETYYYIDNDEVSKLEALGKVIERRDYDTIHGVWTYLTVDDGRMSDSEASYIMIGTIESYKKIVEYFGKDRVVPLLIELEDGERLFRALAREREQEEPKYLELCRRFLADAKDFSEEKIAEAGIESRFKNGELGKCLKTIKEAIIKAKESL